MSEENVEVVRRCYDAYLRCDLESALLAFDPEIEANDHDIPDSGEYRGLWSTSTNSAGSTRMPSRNSRRALLGADDPRRTGAQTGASLPARATRTPLGFSGIPANSPNETTLRRGPFQGYYRE